MLFGFGRKQNDSIADFWAWFVRNSAAIERETRGVSHDRGPSKLITSDLGQALERAHSGLVHEIGVHPDGCIELIISADGIKSAFAGVAAVVDAAPPLKGFRFTAYRPRSTPTTALNMFGHDIGFEQVRYRSLQEGQRLGLDLFIDVEAEDKHRDMMAFILLDMALGEFDVETGIGSVDVRAGAPADLKLLSELPAEFDAFRAQFAQ